MLTTRAIIFRTTKYRDSSLIVDAYTEEKGLRKYIINSVRKAKARTPASLLQVMNLVELTAYDRDDRDINRMKEIRLAYAYQQIPFDVVRGTLGLFMAEVARKTIREREDNGPLFHFLFDAFVFLDETRESLANIHLQFLLELSIHLGIMPSGEWSEETPLFDLREGQFVSSIPDHRQYLEEEQSYLVFRFLQVDRSDAHRIKVEKSRRLALLRNLLEYYSLHLENMAEIKSFEVLRTVLG
ncbi:DNA repair protein RecO [Lewinellaceae bacterium SD302]|nr:DNA repair protein RecO [Lewinellaceae bacterium SD302]